MVEHYKGETITVRDEDSLLAAMGLVDAGPVSYSDRFRCVAKVEGEDGLFSLLEQAVYKNLECTVTLL